MALETQPANAAVIKGLLDQKEQRQQMVANELNPLRDRLGKLRTAVQYGRGNSGELATVKTRVQELEAEHYQLGREIEDLTGQYQARHRWESGTVHDELRAKTRAFI